MSNVILIVVDAVRHYKSGLDERDRLDVYSELKNDRYLEIDRLVVSAPSSVMSSATMLTGLPSFYLARNYSDFIWESDIYDNLPLMLKEKGYDLYGLFGTKEMRDKMKGLFPSIKKDYLSRGIKLHQKKWTNKELLYINKQYFDREISSNPNPFFLMTWFNSRFDNQTSNTIKEFIDYLKTFSFYKDSIIIVTADHGYPDQRRGLTSDGPDLKKAGKPHDLIVTDDNICVPLSIKFPNEYKVNTSIRNLIETKKSFSKPLSQQLLFPTILDVCKIKNVNNSIISEIENYRDDYIRSDARFIFQPNRITSIRNSSYKLIIDHENNTYDYYDLKNNPKETHPNDIDQKIKDNLLGYFQSTEEKANLVWNQKITKKINLNNFKNYFTDGELKILFFGRTSVIVPFVNSVIEREDLSIVLYFIDQKTIDKYANFFKSNLRVELRLINSHNYFDKILVFIEDTFDSILIENLNKVKIKNYLIIDILFNIHSSKFKLVLKSRINKFLGPIRRMSLRRELYKNDIMYFFSDIKYLTKRLITYPFKG
tara:strand:+ start:463 stop:2079 length:1617 start_codon:yes stop_codon:yes gene_type:complete